MITVTFQKNVLFTAKNKMHNMNHSAFWAWVKENEVSEFNFRPSDPEFSDLVNRRINKVIKNGFTVSDSGSLHHYKTAKLEC